MKIKSSYLLLVAVIAPLCFSGPAIQQQSTEIAPTKEYVRDRTLDRREEVARANQNQRDSSVALARVKGRCTIVNPAIESDSPAAKDNPNAQEIAQGEYLLLEASNVLSEGGRAVDSGTGLPMADSTVCTEAGSTAEVVNGYTINVRNIAADDRAEYLEYLDKQY